MELSDVGEMAFERLKVKCFVDLVQLGDKGGTSVEHQEEKVNSARGRAFGTIHVCRTGGEERESTCKRYIISIVSCTVPQRLEWRMCGTMTTLYHNAIGIVL